MAVQIQETPDSRRQKKGGESDFIDLKYVITGTTDDLVVQATVEGTLPLSVDGMVFQDYDIEPLGDDNWYAIGHYGKKADEETGDSSFQFDTSGGTAHITTSLGTVNRYTSGGPAADHQQAIGFDGERVNGTDIVIPQFTFGETHYLAASVVDLSYIVSVFRLTGQMNNATFKGLAQGECLFLGASGAKRGEDDWEISFKFAGSPNVQGLSIGQIGPITKLGWDYLWVEFVDQDDDGAQRIIKIPKQVNVERVYQFGDFSALGIGT